jgi:hypothetical protein
MLRGSLILPKASAASRRTSRSSSLRALIRASTTIGPLIPPNAVAADRRTFASASFSATVRGPMTLGLLMDPSAEAADRRTLTSWSCKAAARGSSANSPNFPRESVASNRTEKSGSLKAPINGFTARRSIVAPNAIAALARTCGSGLFKPSSASPALSSCPYSLGANHMTHKHKITTAIRCLPIEEVTGAILLSIIYLINQWQFADCIGHILFDSCSDSNLIHSSIYQSAHLWWSGMLSPNAESTSC